MKKISKPLGVLETKIVGIQHYNGTIDKDEPVNFKRNPGNPHDKNAIEVHNSKNEMAGHLPEEYASFLAPLLDQDKIFMTGVAGLSEERWFIPLEINISLTQKGKAILTPLEAIDPEGIVHQKILKLFNEWGNVSERRQLEISEECGEYFNQIIYPETLLLMRMMGATEEEEIEDDIYEEATEVSVLDVMKDLGGYQDFLDIIKTDDSEVDETAQEIEMLKFIQKNAGDRQRLMLRTVLTKLMEEVLRKKE